jgi:hypothetical protein
MKQFFLEACTYYLSTPTVLKRLDKFWALDISFKMDVSQIWPKTQPPPNDTPVFRPYLGRNTPKYSEIWRA